jgi:hypothetical protein
VPEGREQLRTGGCESAFGADSSQSNNSPRLGKRPGKRYDICLCLGTGRTTRSPSTLTRHLLLGPRAACSTTVAPESRYGFGSFLTQKVLLFEVLIVAAAMRPSGVLV